MIDTSSKKLNDVEDDDVVVIDGVEARVEDASWVHIFWPSL